MNSISRRSFITSSAALTVAGVAVADVGTGPKTKGAAMLAGIAMREITPKPGVPMWGYSDRSGPSTGTLDALNAQALVLQTPDTTVALVTMDLGRVPARPVMNRIRKRAAAKGVNHVVFTASHTHGGPVIEDESTPHAQMIEGRLGDCVEDAIAQLEPVRIGVGHTTFDIGHNRRVLTKDGRCLMLWRNAERIPTAPVDAEATIIALERPDGSRFATLVHFACHPVVLGSDNREITADWVGEMYREVERESGAPCLFLQGGAGDINPYLDKTPLRDGGVDAMRAVGKECADAVLRTLKEIVANAVEQPRLSYREEMVEVGTRWDFQDPEQQKVFRSVYGGMFDRYLDDLEADLRVPLSVLVINDHLVLAFMPGELFVQFQLDLKTRSPLRDTLLVGYANHFHIYFPTIKDAAAGGYGGSVATYVGLGAGEKLVTRALIAAGELTGRLRPQCVPEDFALEEFGASKA